MNRAPEEKLLTPPFIRVQIATFAYFVGLAMTNPVVPLYVDGPLGRGGVAVGVAVAAFSASALLFRPVSGIFADTKGRRRMMIVGGSVAAISIAMYGFGGSYVALVLARLGSGVGEAMFFVAAAAAAQDLAPDHRRGEATSLFSLAFWGGQAAGPPLGETIHEAYGFHPVWVVAAVICGLSVLAAVGMSNDRPQRVTDRARGIDALIHPAGLLPAALMASSVWGAAAFSAFLPLLTRSRFGSASAGAFVLTAAVVLLIRSLGRSVPDRLGFPRTVAISFVGTGGGLALIGIAPSMLVLYLGTLLFAIGQALAFPSILAMAVVAAPPTQRAAAMSTVSAGFDLSFGVGAMAAGVIVRGAGYSGAIGAGAVASLVGLLVILFGAWRGKVSLSLPA